MEGGVGAGRRMVKVIEPMVPVPAVTDTAPVPVREHVAPAPGVTSAIRAPALMTKYASTCPAASSSADLSEAAASVAAARAREEAILVELLEAEANLADLEAQSLLIKEAQQAAQARKSRKRSAGSDAEPLTRCAVWGVGPAGKPQAPTRRPCHFSQLLRSQHHASLTMSEGEKSSSSSSSLTSLSFSSPTSSSSRNPCLDVTDNPYLEVEQPLIFVSNNPCSFFVEYPLVSVVSARTIM